MRIEQAVILRVHRNIAGADFPWDCVYFFRQTEEKLLPKIFPCALVFRITEEFAQMTRAAIASRFGERGKDRAYAQHRNDEHILNTYVRHVSPVESVLDNREKYVALVPMLHLQGWRNGGEYGPVYLTARPCIPWKIIARRTARIERRMSTGHMKTQVGHAMEGGAYFIYNGEKIQPPCLCCSNCLDFFDGKCHFGLSQCYIELTQIRDADFKAGLEMYRDYIAQGED